jgi:GT2 family glycosyltransferase
MVIRRAVFDQVGGFDEQLAIAYNDVDLCIRVRAAGWRIIWTPTAELYHSSASRGGKIRRAEQRISEGGRTHATTGPISPDCPSLSFMSARETETTCHL